MLSFMCGTHDAKRQFAIDIHEREIASLHSLIHSGLFQAASAFRKAFNLIPVSAVERSKEFYQRLGWRLDDDGAPIPPEARLPGPDPERTRPHRTASALTGSSSRMPIHAELMQDCNA
jgi:hypothetical protein